VRVPPRNVLHSYSLLHIALYFQTLGELLRHWLQLVSVLISRPDSNPPRELGIEFGLPTNVARCA
jgi:hypothetical protein